MNNRIYKFRAWNETNKKMWYDNTESLFNKISLMPYKRNLMITMNGEIRTCSWYQEGVTMDNFTGYKLMQFTGVLAENGEEIYEGDIVEWKDESSDDPDTIRKIETVCWLNVGWNLNSKMTDYKILGNIYEHALSGEEKGKHNEN